METALNPDVFVAPHGMDEKSFRAQYELSESDKGLTVEFHVEPVVMPYLTKLAREGDPAKGIVGNPDAEDVIEYQDFIRITVPGQDKTLIDTPVTPAHIKRFREAYESYKAKEPQKGGTPLTELPGLMPDHVAKFRNLHIHNLEQLAAVTDMHGPNLGLGWRALRDAAKARLANGGVTVADLQRQLAAQAEELAQLKAAGKRNKSQD